MVSELPGSEPRAVSFLAKLGKLKKLKIRRFRGLMLKWSKTLSTYECFRYVALLCIICKKLYVNKSILKTRKKIEQPVKDCPKFFSLRSNFGQSLTGCSIFFLF